jgi:hypothetical protein
VAHALESVLYTTAAPRRLPVALRDGFAHVLAASRGLGRFTEHDYARESLAEFKRDFRELCAALGMRNAHQVTVRVR